MLRSTLLLTFILAASNWPAYAETNPAIRVTLLGTGTPAVRAHRMGPSTLIEAGAELLLFDAGRGTTLRLQQAGIPLGKVTRLFLTHLHSDHIVGLPDLWLTGWLFGRQQSPLTVWGPVGTEQMMANLGEAVAFDIEVRSTGFAKLRPDGMAQNANDISEGVVYRSNGVTVTAFNVNHAPLKHALGYRIDYLGRTVVLSGDTMYSENLIQFSKGVDLLVHEVAFASEDSHNVKFERQVVATHTTPVEAGRLFKLIQPRLAVFNHVITFDPADDSQLLAEACSVYDGPVELGQDLMTITVGETLQILDKEDATTRLNACERNR